MNAQCISQYIKWRIKIQVINKGEKNRNDSVNAN
jgi:hypothetical protein